MINEQIKETTLARVNMVLDYVREGSRYALKVREIEIVFYDEIDRFRVQENGN